MNKRKLKNKQINSDEIINNKMSCNKETKYKFK